MVGMVGWMVISVMEISSVPIVQTILDLGHNLHMEVVAEGVETSMQRDTLSRMGCRLFQGYFMGPPMTVQEIEERLEAQQIRAFKTLLSSDLSDQAV